MLRAKMEWGRVSTATLLPVRLKLFHSIFTVFPALSTSKWIRLPLKKNIFCDAVVFHNFTGLNSTRAPTIFKEIPQHILLTELPTAHRLSKRSRNSSCEFELGKLRKDQNILQIVNVVMESPLPEDQYWEMNQGN